jgi:hypothetical protein
VTVNTGEGEVYLVDSNVALVVQPGQNRLRAFSAVTATWESQSVTVNTGDGEVYLVGADG